MKPTPLTSSNKNASAVYPVTDYGYQPTAAVRTAGTAIRPGTKPLGFHKLSSGFFNIEAPRDNVTELLGFGLITAISAWPIASALIAMVRLARNY